MKKKQKAKASVKQLIDKARLEVKDAAIQKKVLELIEAILVNKFPNLSREEIKEMLSMELIKGTRVYEELKEEAKEEAKQELKEKLKEEAKEEAKQELKEKLKEEVKIAMAKKLMQRGMNVEEIAEVLELNVEIAKKIVEEK